MKHKSKIAHKQICKQCGSTDTGSYCSNCGQSLHTGRLTIAEIIHEVFHFFTHLDKGFPYTLKQLAFRPGKMQKEYVSGQRIRHQKPFSMVFICGTITALALYIIHKPSADASNFNQLQSEFNRHYYVFVQLGLLPVYALVTWLLFKNTKINYAESLVLFSYALSFLLLLVIAANLMTTLIPNRINSAFYEIPILYIYLAWTYINYFSKQDKQPIILLKSFVNIVIGYFISNYTADFIVYHIL